MTMMEECLTSHVLVSLDRARNVVVKVFFVLMIGLTIDCELRGDIGTSVLTPTFYNLSHILTPNLGHAFNNKSKCWTIDAD